MSQPGFKPTLCWTEAPELEFGALNRSATTPHRVEARPVLLVSYKSFFSILFQRASEQKIIHHFWGASFRKAWYKVSKLFLLWGHAISWTAFCLCSFSMAFDTPYHFNSCVSDLCWAAQCIALRVHCWAKLLSSGGQARPAPPTVATTPTRNIKLVYSTH